jgi:rhodanese-related sulfurtransferase
MLKNLLGLLLLSSVAFAKITNIPVTIEFIEKTPMKIIDIRTEKEWQRNGIIYGAYLITFFDNSYGYDSKKFLEELNQIVTKDEQFAIICNTGSRTKLISNFLGKKHDYDVVNLVGGMKKLQKEGFKVEYYEPHKKRASLKKREDISDSLSLSENNNSK